MKAKEYLSEIRTHQQLIRALEQKAEELRTQAEGMKAITYDKDRVQVSPANTMESMIIRLVEVEERLGEELLKYHAELNKRISQIRQLPPDYAEILIQRYVMTGDHGEALTWEQIAVNIHKSFGRVTHLHGEALVAFENRYFKVSKQ